MNKDTLDVHVSKVYDHITHGKVSKPSTDPDAVISAADEVITELVNEATVGLQSRVEYVETKLLKLRRAIYSLAFYHAGLTKEEIICKLIESISDWKVTEEDK